MDFSFSVPPAWAVCCWPACIMGVRRVVSPLARGGARHAGQNYRPGLDVVRLAALLWALPPLLHRGRRRAGFAVPTAFIIGRGMALPGGGRSSGVVFSLPSGAALCPCNGLPVALSSRSRRRHTSPGVLAGFGGRRLCTASPTGNTRFRVGVLYFLLFGVDASPLPCDWSPYKIGEWFLGVIPIFISGFPPCFCGAWNPPPGRRSAGCSSGRAGAALPLVCPARRGHCWAACPRLR